MLNRFAEHSCQVNKKTTASENLSGALSRGPRRLLCVLICVFWPFLGGYNSFLPEHQTQDMSAQLRIFVGKCTEALQTPADLQPMGKRLSWLIWF